MQRSYLVATNNYRAFSSTLVNPGEERIVLASPDENRHVLAEYVRHYEDVDAKGRWALVLCPMGGAATCDVSDLSDLSTGHEGCQGSFRVAL